jgi:CelD/BcsL family acetyltransferase involved in cellulose biosynthesis
MVPNGFVTCTHRELSSLPNTEEWKALWRVCEGTPFQSPEWLTTWLQVFAPPEMKLVEVRRGTELVGIAPLCCFEANADGPLVCVGAYTSDYLDWLIHPQFAEEVIQAVFQELLSSGLSGRKIALSDLPSRSPLLRVALPGWISVRCEPCDACPVVVVPTELDDPDMIIPARQRRNLRTAEHRSSHAGVVDMVTATSESSMAELLDALFRLHQRRWNEEGQPGVLSYENARVFHTTVSRLFLQAGMLRLFGMRLNGSIIAVIYGFAAHGTVYCYLQGFDPEFVRLSPGAQVLGYLIRDAVRSGDRVIDFLRGREDYKYQWGAQDQATYRLNITLSAASSNTGHVPPVMAA